MLVLSRKPEEKIHIGPDITITIVRITNNTVRLGIDAPKSLNIIRGELAKIGEVIEETATSLIAEVPLGAVA